MSARASRKELHWDRLITCYAERPRDVDAMLQESFATSSSALAVVDGDVRMTYADVAAKSAALAAGLSARGVRQGDRVAVMLVNGVDAVVAIAAIVRLGAILVPLGTRQRAPELSYIFADAEPVVIIHGPEFAGEIAAAEPMPALRLDTVGVEYRSLLDGQDGQAPPEVEIAEEDVFGILYTSGTTGKPKGAMLTHLGVVHSCLHWEEAHGLRRGEVTLFCVPWSHVSGLCGVLLPFLYLGATLVMLPEFKRRIALQLAATERITHALMVPAMYGLCLLEPDLAEFDLRDWRIGAYGGAPMPEPTIRRFAEVFPGLAMCNAYGATETTSPATAMPPGEGVARADSIGRTVRCGEIHVMSDAGIELPTGEEGELWIGGPMVVPGYWRNVAADAASFVSGYWKSGDIGSVDAAGYVRIADRKKDMINRGGFKVYPAEVESVLAGLDGVLEAAVVGAPDPMLGESVIAFLTVAGDDLKPAVVRAWCAERMSDYKVPGHVVIGSCALPRNANGKIQKAELRIIAAALPPLHGH